MKKTIVLCMLALAACAEGKPAPKEYWTRKMCTQPKYQHLDRCKEVDSND